MRLENEPGSFSRAAVQAGRGKGGGQETGKVGGHFDSGGQAGFDCAGVAAVEAGFAMIQAVVPADGWHSLLSGKQGLHDEAAERTGRDDMNDVPLEAEERDSRRQRNDGGDPVEGTGEAPGPQHVVAEEQGQVQDHPDHGGGDGGQRCGERDRCGWFR